MKKQSMAARLRAAQERAILAERALNQATSTISRLQGDYSGNEIVTGISLGDSASAAIRTARLLDCIVVCVPDRNEASKFSLRAIRKA